jgi:hypothetical protein
MPADKIGRLLLAAGLLVGIAGGVGLLTGFEPARLPRELLNIAAYKLTFLAAFGLLAGGAIFRRYARRDAQRRTGEIPAADRFELTAGQPIANTLRANQRERAPVRSPGEQDD